jgi:nitrate reductase NapD
MSTDDGLVRRDFLLRPFAQARPGAPAADAVSHISSAVVTVRPERAAEIARGLGALPGVEVHAVAHSKIVLVLEAPDSGTIGARLAEIALMDGVFSANMVFEQIDGPAAEGPGAGEPGGQS